jgi:putative membrane protein insertion efficiency factor
VTARTLLTRLDRVLAWPLLALVWLYRKLLSPALPPACRFYPSCSAYADEALRHHGLTRGAPLMLWRLCRCHPLTRGGFDPVPGTTRPAARGAAEGPKESECTV